MGSLLRMNQAVVLALGVCYWAGIMAPAAAEESAWTWSGETMGSRYRVTVAAPPASPELRERVAQAMDQRLQEINRQMSHYLPDSELSRFNRAAAHAPFAVSRELADVVQFALEMSRLSQGAFDPTLGPLINLWGFGEKGPAASLPTEEALQQARQRVGWQWIKVTPSQELIKSQEGVALNLSALAKGYAVDEMVRLLHRHGLTNVFASIAGEIRVSGHNPAGRRWRIGISAPLELWRENDPLAAAVELKDLAISTSGDYQKFFYDAQGRRLAHILDPRTGRPVQHALGSVTVVAPTGLESDALSTTLFVLGAEQGLQFIEGRTNAAALFIVRVSEHLFRLIPSSRLAAMTGWRPPP